MVTLEELQLLDNVKFDILKMVEQLRKHITYKYCRYATFNDDNNNIILMNDVCYDTEIVNRKLFYFECSYFGDESLHRCALELLAYLLENYKVEFFICQRIVNNYMHKRTRLRKFITEMLKNDCLYLTCTFTEDVLNNTSVDTRRVYIRRFLSKFKTNAVANIDFGDKKEREHYHAIIELPFINHTDYKYGNLDFERVTNNGVSQNKLSTYITKLTYHALKDSTKNKSSLIYIHKK